ncbi:class A beta-lactamase [Paremcibacter congregatus]|uniref:beta-lactamase n=1 Tax=Paremcibacter congregatus TaxID=2043170 RepID=A0A2G4YVP2_9PROT|nr:class A beta-lactamase [Paremcibacter congregatus]PHZ86385.1 hypothetical protein CRD36_00385 [Paremcibacter congregatus]QDE28518.1 class A beta-lactamase [Paremcibacter congregatus]
MIKKYMFLICSGLIFFLSISSSYSSSGKVIYNPTIDIDVLLQEIRRIAERNRGNVGVAVRHLETGKLLSFNGDAQFLMASTYKIPIAVRILQLVDQGKLSLDDLIEIRKDEYVSWSIIADRFNRGPVSISISNLMELMLVLSDNTATDVLLRIAGGGKAVTAMLRDQNIKEMTVSRGTKDLIIDFASFAPLTKLVREDGLSFAEAWSSLSPLQLQELSVIEKQRSQDPKWAAYLSRNNDDKAEPNAMLQLLDNIWTGDILTNSSKKILQKIMERCETGKGRIKGKLPKNTIVMHKTGTLDTAHGVINNVGVIQLPGNKGNIAIVVYTKDAGKGIEFNEEIIADISQAVYNYFVYTIKGK